METVKSAISNANVELLEELLINGSSKERAKVLDLTLIDGNKEIVELVLLRGVSQSSKDNALLIAIKSENLELVKVLLNYAASVINNDHSEEPPIFAAVKTANIDLVKLLCERGANVNVKIGKGRTVLAHACLYSNLKIVAILIDHGADLTCRDRFGLNPIQLTFRSGHNDKINFLLKLMESEIISAEDVNKLYLLHYAVQSRTVEEKTIDKLLQLGANVKAFRGNRNVLDCAIETGNLKIIEYLLTKGADAFSGNELLTAVCTGNLKTVKLLLQHGHDVHRGDDYSLAIAVKKGNLEMVKLLFQHGADINREIHRVSISFAVECAVAKGKVKIVKLIVDKGFSVGTTLFYAIKSSSDKKVLKLLLKEGLDPNYSIDSVPALCYAADGIYGNLEAVKLLLGHGADVNKLSDGFSSLVNANNAFYSDEMSRFLVRHIVLMVSQGLFVREELLNAVADGNEKLLEFKNKCFGEIAFLKNKKFVGSTLTYHNFLITKDVHKLATLVGNENISSVAKSVELKRKIIPIYWDLFADNFDRATSKQKDFHLIRRFFNYITPQLPFTVVSKLFHYFNREDVDILRKL